MIRSPIFLCLLYATIGGVVNNFLHTSSCCMLSQYFISRFLFCVNLSKSLLFQALCDLRLDIILVLYLEDFVQHMSNNVLRSLKLASQFSLNSLAASYEQR